MKHDITFVQSPNLRFTEQELAYLTLLKESKRFWKCVLAIRKIAKLPLEGFKIVLKDAEPSDEYLGHVRARKHLFKTENEKLLSLSSGIVQDKLNLSIAWNATLAYIIIFNIATPPVKEENMRVVYEKHPTFSSLSSIQISVRERMSFDKFVSELKLRKKELKKHLDKLPSLPNKNISAPNIARIKSIPSGDLLLQAKKIGVSHGTLTKYLSSDEFSHLVPFIPTKSTISKYLKKHKMRIKAIDNALKEIRSFSVHGREYQV